MPGYNITLEMFSEICGEYHVRDLKWYGGAYIDEGGIFCVKIVDYSQKDWEYSKFMNTLCKNENIRFEYARYSLYHLKKRLDEIMNDPASIKAGIVGAGINEITNKITLAVSEDYCTEGSLDDMITVERFEGSKTDACLAPSDILSNGKCFFSAGYPAINSQNVRGIVTAGHLSEIQKNMTVYADGSEIGCIGGYEFSSSADAAFIELFSGRRCADIISVAPNPRINALAPELLCGAAADMYSGKLGCARSGKVKYPSFDFMDMKNIIVFTYSASAGDSGSPILIPPGTEKNALIGIHLGTLIMEGKVYSYGRSAKDINKRLSLEFDFLET